jgi:ribosomal protein L29
MPDKNLRDEITELTEAVRELRDREVADTLRDLRAEVERLRAERATHHCVGCKCMHIHWYPTQGTVTYPLYTQYWQTTCGSGTNVGVAPYVTTNSASGYNPAVTTFSISN